MELNKYVGLIYNNLLKHFLRDIITEYKDVSFYQSTRIRREKY